MSGISVGGIVESKCGKCDDVTGHVVMALVGGEIVKVECRACGSVHKYRPADKAPRPKTPATVKRAKDGSIIAPPSRQAPVARKESRAGAAKAQALAQEAAAHWQEVMHKADSADCPPYSLAGTFAVQSFLTHPVFGVGQVIAHIAPDKMDVVFEQGIKRLKCAM